MTPEALLFIEDDDLVAAETGQYLSTHGWEVSRARDLAQARAIFKAGALVPLVVLSDMNLPDGSGLDLLEEVIENGLNSAEWVFLTGYGSIPDTVRALRLGAYDFLEKPCAPPRLELVVGGAARAARARRELWEQKRSDHERYSPDAFLGTSSQARSARSFLGRLCQLPIRSALIEGETGTGKGLAARILHYGGIRAAGPLVETNCAALPRDLAESELFGHEAGAFTGAKGRHRGMFEQATGGTLFLDEVSELDLGLQAKLLKVVEDRRFRRVGGERDIEVDVHLVAASNRDLHGRVEEGLFRADLLHRLAVLKMELPPLRDRPEDIVPIAWAAIEEFGSGRGQVISEVPDDVWNELKTYSWPGNVRELRNVLERSVLLSSSRVLSNRWFGFFPESPHTTGPEPGTIRVPIDGSLNFDQIEEMILREALERARGNVSAAARLLGMSRQTFRYRIEKHGMKSADEDGA